MSGPPGCSAHLQAAQPQREARPNLLQPHANRLFCSQFALLLLKKITMMPAQAPGRGSTYPAGLKELMRCNCAAEAPLACTYAAQTTRT